MYWHQFPTLFHSFPNEFVSGEHFPFSLSFFFFLLADQQGGAWPPCAPLAMPVGGGLA